MKKVLKAWNWLESFAAGVFAFSACMIVLYAVFMRYVLKSAPEWTEEIAIYIVVMAVFIIASTLTNERGHVGATFIVERIPIKYRRIIEIVNGISALSFCFIVTYFGIRIVMVALTTGERSASSIRFPLWISYLSVPIGMSLVSLRHIMHIYRLVFHFNPKDLKAAHESEDKLE